jgi:endoglucanase
MTSGSGATNGQGAIGYVTESQIKQLSDLGFDHIRLPIDETMYYVNAATFNKDTTTLRLIKDCIGWCAKYKMKVILNFHIPGNRAAAGYKKEDYWTSATIRAHGVDLWRHWSVNFRSYSDTLLAYELFNEPDCPDDNMWNTFQNQMIAAVREDEPNRVLFVSPNGYNNPERVNALQLPANDPNLVVTFHFYKPQALTHYPVSYINSSGQKVTPRYKLTYPGQIFAQANLSYADSVGLNYYKGNFTVQTQIDYRLDDIINFYHNNNGYIRVHCGEFGCNDEYEKQVSPYPQGSVELKYKLFDDYAEMFYKIKTEEGVLIPHTVWGYKAGFGLFKSDNTQKYPAQTINGTSYHSIIWTITKSQPAF